MAGGLVNLLRNAKVFYTTLNKAQVQTASNITPGNTWELQVMSDFKFSQNTEQQTIQLNEAGATPARGTRSFNTKINPVDWSFGTYVRPYAVATGSATVSTSTAVSGGKITVTTSTAHAFSAGDLVTSNGSGTNKYFVDTVLGTATAVLAVAPGSAGIDEDGSVLTRAVRTTAPEALLWNALVSADQPYSNGTGTSSWVEAATSATLSMTRSNVHSFVSFGLIFKVDNTIYYIDKCAVNQADMNFGIDQIAMISWSGQGTEMLKLDNTGGVFAAPAGTGSLDKVIVANTWDDTASFITNKLSSVALTGYNIVGTTTAGQVYTLALTGGQITINNNINYLTPETLGAVNKSIGYFSGSRSISGNINAYLKVSDDAGRYASELLDDLVRHSLQQPDNMFNMQIGVGAAGNTYPQMVLTLPGAMLQIPSVDVQDVVSATINFTGQATSTGNATTTNAATFDIGGTNELIVTYKTAA